MKYVWYLIWISRFSCDFLKKGLPFDFLYSSHVVSIEGMRNIIFIDFSFEIKFNSLVEMVQFGGVTLFDNNFDDKLSFEFFIVDNRDILDVNLYQNCSTYSLL